MTLSLSAEELAPPPGELPPFGRFEDPYPLPHRSLKRERNLAWKEKGTERQLVMAHLAARLWKIANGNLDQIRALEQDALARGVPLPEAKISALRREASAHLQECVTLLEGVLETPGPPRMARVRLAHYLRELNPPAAIPLIRGLLADEPRGPVREALALDLAQLLLREGAPREAAALFPEEAGPAATPRGRLLRALAQADLPAFLEEATLQGVLTDCGGAASTSSAVIAKQLPALLAAVERPALVFERLRRTPPACVRDRLGRVSVELTERLLGRGRMGSARELRETLRRGGLPLPAPLDDHVRQLAGPYGVSFLPPGDARLGRLLSYRLRAVVRCAQPLALTVAFVLRVQPDGRAVLRPSSPPPRSASGNVVPRAGAPAVPGSSSISVCLGQAVPRWRLPPWRSPVVLEITVSLSIRADARRRNRSTDPG